MELPIGSFSDAPTLRQYLDVPVGGRTADYKHRLKDVLRVSASSVGFTDIQLAETWYTDRNDIVPAPEPPGLVPL